MKISTGIYKILLITAAGFITLAACSKEDSAGEVVLPSNLVIEIIQDTLTEGLVTVEAKADKANFYTIIFEEGGQSISKESNDGKATYQYSNGGNYSIVARAHTTTDKFIELTRLIEVNIGNGGGQPSKGYSTPLTYPGYTLVWQDEFEGTALNTSSWNYEIGTGNSGWGNNELQYYLQQNTSVGNGILTIEAKEEFFNGNTYTSSRLTTQNKKSFQYGRIDIRAAMPFGQGIWPALWMMGDNFSTDGWPECGEIDIMEMVGGTTSAADRGDAVTHGTAHWSNNGTYATHTGSNKLSSGRLSDEFHVYSIIWDDQSINWYRDDIKYHSLDITPSTLSEFHQKFFFIINVAVGGNWPGSPNSSTQFPQKMYVDYVRVFQR